MLYCSNFIVVSESCVEVKSTNLLHSSVNVFNTRALIDDTIFTPVLGEWTTISMSRDHPSHV